MKPLHRFTKFAFSALSSLCFWRAASRQPGNYVTATYGQRTDQRCVPSPAEQAGQALGLPAAQAAKMLENGFDFYAITAKPGTNPTVFVSDIASTTQGAVRTSPTAQQVIVPNRSLWSDPWPVDPFSLP